MKIALAQQNYHIGNFEANTIKIITAIQQAEAQGADLVVFTELSICGYPPRDFLEFADFIKKSQACIQTILPYTKNIGVVLGCPTVNPMVDGKDLYNSAYVLHQEKIIGVQHKTLLPTYDVSDESRYFEPAHEWNCITFKNKNHKHH